MIKHAFLAGLGMAFAGLVAIVPAHAQGSPLIVYGNDKCPAGAICVRAPEGDRYRIPQSLRSEALPPAQAPNRNAIVSSTGGANTGPATCSNIGGGGGASCLKNQIQGWKAERDAKATADANSAEPR